MCDAHISGGTSQADAASPETSTHVDEREVSQEYVAHSGAYREPSSPGPSHLDVRELRHEVRNALTVAVGYAQWLRLRSAQWTDERDRQALEAIHLGIVRACHLLDDNQHHGRRLPVELRHLVAQAVSQVPPLRIGDVVIRILTAEPLVGLWDGDQLSQVLVNLLDNAGKYSPPGTPIVIELAREAAHARIVVRDQGIGVAGDEVAAIFDGYRTSLARTTAVGSGIGLQLCRRLVHAEGGQLGVTSQPGHGSAFWVTLPLAETSATASPEGPDGT